MLERYFEAFAFANRAHRGQARKVNGTPYISHPMAVAFALEKIGSSQDLVIAGVLHDVLEDTDISEEELEKHFGKEVTALVKAVSESKNAGDWDTRKLSYIKKIEDSSLDVKRLSLVDKIHNLYSLKFDFLEHGSMIWNSFSAPMEKQKWYYSTLLKIYRKNSASDMEPLIEEMNSLIEAVFDQE